MTKVFKFFICMACALGLTGSVRADFIRVSQESSAGSGDFSSNVLGTISTFNVSNTLASYYSYDIPNNVSYGNNPPSLTVNRSHLFLVHGTDGLGLFIVYDRPQSGNNGGGSANADYTLVGDTANFIVRDDPSDTYSNTGGTVFNTIHNWVSPNTDGTVIGSLDGNWSMFIDFNSWSGLNSWSALSQDGNDIGLSLQANRRVLLEITAVPVPAGIVMSSIGIIGIGGFTWLRRRKVQMA